MDRSTSVSQIALGVMLGNLGCFILWMLFSCITFVVLNLLGVGLLSALSRQFR